MDCDENPSEYGRCLAFGRRVLGNVFIERIVVEHWIAFMERSFVPLSVDSAESYCLR